MSIEWNIIADFLTMIDTFCESSSYLKEYESYVKSLRDAVGYRYYSIPY